MDHISDDLLGRYFTRKCTLSEKKKIEKWIRASEENKKYFIELINIWHKVKETYKFDFVDTDKAEQELLYKLRQTEEYKSSKSKPYLKPSPGNHIYAILRIAAVFIIILGILAGSFIIYKHNITAGKKQELSKSYREGMLILADGTAVPLGTEDSELSYDQTGTEILFRGDTIKNIINGTQKKKALVYNEIIIPKGQKLKLSLPDSSQVWLNSASSLKFPLSFSKSERRVILNGEAFFEVKNNTDKPFKVQTSQMLIEVLGTSFNVSSYDDDSYIETTLVSGSLEVITDSKLKEKDHIILKPEYKATMHKESMSVSVEKVDVEIYTSWKDGYFKFQSTSFEDVTKKLSRNYGIKIEIISQELKTEKFSGKLWQKDNIEDVLKYIQISTPMQFYVEENNIIISSI